MRKGAKVIYNNSIYTVWSKKNNFITIYKAESEAPEATMITTSIRNVKKA